MATRPARRAWTGVWTAALLLGLAGALALLACAAPVNHDEDQYLAATVLAARLRPFQDFLYLQTPLQPWLTAPYAALFPGYAFVALRLLSAAFGAGILAAVYAGQRGLGVGRREAAFCTALMATSFIFQFSCSVFRNDALPALMLSLGLVASLAALRVRTAPSLLWAVAGFALAAAASAKISFAIPLAALGMVVLARVFVRPARGATLLDLLGFGLGALAGLAPTLLAWASASEAFRYGVFEYATRDTFDWYRMNGLGARLGLPAKLVDSFLVLSVGTAIPALAMIVHAVWRRWRGKTAPSDAALLLEIMILAGLVAALAPTPTYRQYFMPLLPPLFLRLGLEMDRLLRPADWREQLIAAGMVIGGGLGLGYFAMTVGAAAANGRWPVVDVTREAQWIGSRLKAAGANGVVATLSPRVVLDSGYPLDLRFADGVFVYRTADRLSEDQQRRLHIVSPLTQARFFAETPPAAIVTGYEAGATLHPEDSLRAYAQSHGYRRIASPVGRAELYIRPVYR